MATYLLNNPHPGEILKVEFLEPLSLSQNALAEAIGVPANRINEIVRGRRSFTADTGLRLGNFLVYPKVTRCGYRLILI